MQNGRTIILATVAVALAMSGAAWWFHYQGSRQSAQFWGAEAAELIIGQSKFTFVELGDVAPAAPAKLGRGYLGDPDLIAGRPIAATHDLTEKPGVIHLRHAITQDANYLWDARRRESIAVDYDWGYAFRFAEGDRELVVLVRRDFQQIGRVEADGAHVDVLPCPKLAPAIQQYLGDIGVLKPK